MKGTCLAALERQEEHLARIRAQQVATANKIAQAIVAALGIRKEEIA